MPTQYRTYRELIEAAKNAEGEFVTVERHGEWARVRMNDPERYNSLTPVLTHQLQSSLRELADDPDIRVVVLTGADPAFSAGGDLELIKSAQSLFSEGSDGTPGIWRWIRYQFGGIVRLLVQTDTIYIAAINGPAAGVGLAFALACDQVVASDRARLVTAFGKIGLIPEVGTSWLLTRRLGYHRTFELFVSGEELDAQRAESLGLVNRVVAHEELDTTVEESVQAILALPESVTAMSKTTLRKAEDMSWEQAITIEELAEPNCFTPKAHRDAVDELMEALARKRDLHSNR